MAIILTRIFSKQVNAALCFSSLRNIYLQKKSETGARDACLIVLLYEKCPNLFVLSCHCDFLSCAWVLFSQNCLWKWPSISAGDQFCLQHSVKRGILVNRQLVYVTIGDSSGHTSCSSITSFVRWVMIATTRYNNEFYSKLLKLKWEGWHQCDMWRRRSSDYQVYLVKQVLPTSTTEVSCMLKAAPTIIFTSDVLSNGSNDSTKVAHRINQQLQGIRD